MLTTSTASTQGYANNTASPGGVCYVILHHQVQEEFDDVDKMWRSLPTDVQLLERQTLSRDEMVEIFRGRGGFESDLVTDLCEAKGTYEHSNSVFSTVRIHYVKTQGLKSV